MGSQYVVRRSKGQPAPKANKDRCPCSEAPLMQTLNKLVCLAIVMAKKCGVLGAYRSVNMGPWLLDCLTSLFIPWLRCTALYSTLIKAPSEIIPPLAVLTGKITFGCLI